MMIRLPEPDTGRLPRLFQEVNEALFQSNVTLELEAKSSRSYRVKIGVRDSYGYGARTSASGRHGPYACWHVFRDVLGAWFTAYPDMIVRTALATYRGQEGFADNFPQTYWHNVGSMMYPAQMGQLCQCAEDLSDVEAVQYAGASEPTARREDRPSWRSAPRRPAVEYSTADYSYIDAASSAMREAEAVLLGFDLVGLPIVKE